MYYHKYPRQKPVSQDIIFGIHTVSEALSENKLDTVYVSNKNHALFKDFLQKSENQDVIIKKVPVEKINSLTNKGNHQGVLGFLRLIEFENLENIVINLFEKGETPLLLILDEITDVRNAGAIIRSAECLGVHALVVPEKNSFAFQGDLAKTSSGAVFHLPACRVKNLLQTIEFLQHSGIKICACTEKAESDIYSVDMNSPLALIFGNEEKGISKVILDKCDMKGKIPMSGKTESLNVSVAVGITLSESVRQRNAQN